MLHLELIPKLRFVNQNTLTPDNNGTSKLNKSKVISSFFLKMILSTGHAVLLSPDAELIQYGHQRLPTFREFVLHLRRDLWVLGADNQSVFFQFFQVGAERFIRDGFQIPFQLVEPHDLKLHQAVENDHLVLAGDQRQRVGEVFRDGLRL